MSSVQRYSTASAGSRAHIAYWNGVVHDLLVPLTVTANDSNDFEAELAIGQIGPMSMAKIRSTPVVVDYDTKHVEQADPRFFSLHVAIEGTLRFQSFGEESVLEPGDLVLSDSHAPSRMRCDEPSLVLSTQFDAEALGTVLPTPERFLGIPIRTAHPTGKLVNGLMLGIWEQIELGVPDEFALPLRQSLMQTVGMYFALEHGSRIGDATSNGLHRSAIKRYIEGHLTDPSLSAQTIAESMSVSTRYVFRAFAGERESLSQYIQRRRLEQAGFYLRNALWSHWTITKIALHWGFASVPHFSRVFKQHYGMTPGEFRREAA